MLIRFKTLSKFSCDMTSCAENGSSNIKTLGLTANIRASAILCLSPPLNPFRKVKALVDEAIKLSRTKKEKFEKEREKLYDMLGITTVLDGRRGNELSGGERQRIALARLNPKF